MIQLMTTARRKKTVAEAKARHDQKKRREGKSLLQVWLDTSDKENINTIKNETGLKTQSEIISHALNFTVSYESNAQSGVHSDQNDAQIQVHDIDKGVVSSDNHHEQ